MNQRYFTDAVCVIITYDITDKSSLSDTTKWLAMVDNFCPPNTLKVLVGNKTDLFEDRSVTRQEALSFVQDYELDLWFEISAKDGTEVNEMMQKVAQTISDRASVMRTALEEEYQQFRIEADEEDS